MHLMFQWFISSEIGEGEKALEAARKAIDVFETAHDHRRETFALFADGGLSALGLSVFNMSLIGVWVGYGAFLLIKKVLPKNKSSIPVAAFIAGIISVPAAARAEIIPSPIPMRM